MTFLGRFVLLVDDNTLDDTGAKKYGNNNKPTIAICSENKNH
jgi:hypothetical protein